MTKKLDFSVEDVRLVDENPKSNFAVMEVDFFASGKNLHDMYVSESTLFRTADTIKNCPLVWVYDVVLDDIGTHDKAEVACGFVPEKTEITNKKTADGRTMLTVMAYVWKRYTGELLNFFKRDGGEKPVSVEMSVFDMRDLPNGLKELIDYKFEAITILGTFVTPAIPGAKSKVLSFAEEYKSLVEKEFSKDKYADIDFTIPEEVKKYSNKGLAQYLKLGGANSVLLAVARHLSSEKNVSPEKVRYIAKHIKSKQGQPKDTKDAMLFMLMGGNPAIEWATSIAEKLDEADNRVLSYFDAETDNIMPYSNLTDINPSLKGIEPPISLSQANSIAKQADAIGADKGGWGIAIKKFKDSHTVEDGKWVEKEKSTEEMTMPNEDVEKAEGVKDEEMSAAPAPEEKGEDPAEEKAESPAKEKKEEETGKEKSFEFPKNFNTELMSAMFADDEDEDVKMAKAELEKGVFAEPGVVMSGMFAKMCKMAKAVEQMAAETKAYMAENDELKKFKADMESEKKESAVFSTMKELEEKFVVPADVKDEMLRAAEDYEYANLSTWQTFCKAKCFDFAVKTETASSGPMKIGMPFTTTAKTTKDDLWANN